MSCTSCSCIKLSRRGSAVPLTPAIDGSSPVWAEHSDFFRPWGSNLTRSLSQDTADDVARSHQCEASDPRIPRRGWRDSAAIQQHLPVWESEQGIGQAFPWGGARDFHALDIRISITHLTRCAKSDFWVKLSESFNREVTFSGDVFLGRLVGQIYYLVLCKVLLGMWDHVSRCWRFGKRMLWILAATEFSTSFLYFS